MVGAYAERSAIGRTFNGLVNRSAAQELSLINNKSELVSDLSQHDISAYISKEKKKMANDPHSKIASNTAQLSGLLTKTEDNSIKNRGSENEIQSYNRLTLGF